MNKDLRRRQKKAKKAAAAAQRRAKAAAKAQAPRFDTTLPTTVAAIEAEMEAVLARIPTETPGEIEYHETGRTIHLSPAQVQMMRLQKQLFRVVFGREPGPHDPVVWDRDREHEGVFPFNPEKHTRELARSLTATDIRPEIAYAVALTGMAPTDRNSHLYREEDLEEWREAVDDYVHQAATGVIPLLPTEFLHAWNTVNGVAAHPNVVPIGLAGYANTTENRMVITLEGELGTQEKAIAAMTRMAALVVLAEEEEEFNDLVSPEGYSELAIWAAASAEIDRRTRSFDAQSFRERLDALTEDDGT